ncbi:methyltransferase family protein [Massilia sp. GCM10023247]|uniref:methyltransferase family protein n=1 Tax=Massilia sp. GCM10023247 TaxID=3252643 RepID=UPI003611A77A
MNASLGNFFFRYRNGIGPVVFLVAISAGTPTYPLNRPDLNLMLDLVGVFVALLGQILRIMTIGYDYIERGGRNRQVYASKLVQGGVFAHCRNPLYVGNILLAIGMSMVVHSLVFYLTVLPLVILAYRSIVAAEERFLSEQFGDEYAQYCRRVHRWIPRWKGWRHSIENMEFNWRRVLVKEYNTLFVSALALAVVKIWSDYHVQGAAVLPSTSALSAAFGLWLAAYVFVRSLKKSGVITP